LGEEKGNEKKNRGMRRKTGVRRGKTAKKKKHLSGAAPGACLRVRRNYAGIRCESG
jgi:hypothetical protein